MQIFLDPTPEYGQNAVFMLVRCAEANISGNCRFTEFTLEGFGRLSHCARAPNSVSAYALHLHFSDVWPLMQSPEMLWRWAEVLGLPDTGLRSDPDGRQACSRLCHELFGKHPEENSGKVVTAKFKPWAEAMFEQAVSATAAFDTPSNAPSEALQKPSPDTPGPSSVGEQDPSKRRRPSPHSAEESEPIDHSTNPHSAEAYFSPSDDGPHWPQSEPTDHAVATQLQAKEAAAAAASRRAASPLPTAADGSRAGESTSSRKYVPHNYACVTRMTVISAPMCIATAGSNVHCDSMPHTSEILCACCRKSRDEVDLDKGLYFLSFASECEWLGATEHHRVEIMDTGLDYGEGALFMFFRVRSREVHLDGFGRLGSAVKVCEQRAETSPAAKGAVRLNKEAASPPLRFLQANPKKPGSASYGRYEQYKSALSYQEMLKLGGTKEDFNYDLKKGFIVKGSASLTPALGTKTSIAPTGLAGKVELNFSALWSSQLSPEQLWNCAKREEAGGLLMDYGSTFKAGHCWNLCTELLGKDYLECSGFPVTKKYIGWAHYMLNNATVVFMEKPSRIRSPSPKPQPEARHLKCADIEGHPGATNSSHEPWKHAHILGGTETAPFLYNLAHRL